MTTPEPTPASGPGPLRVRHMSLTNGSGLHRVAESLAKAETSLGLDSKLVDTNLHDETMAAVDADIFVVHSHLPPVVEAKRKKSSRIVYVGHGTPDHIYQSSVEEAEHGGYGHADPLMLLQHWLKHADARVTFWDRHKWIYDQMLSRGARPADCIPMGVDLAFWQAGGESEGKFAGEPSLFYGENPHYIKWAYDLMTALPTIAKAHPGVMLHTVYQVRDHHRALFPWFNALGASFHSHIAHGTFPKPWLRNAFKSTDFVVGLVRYGDLNHLSMEANAAGAVTVSYPGNPYSDFWIQEGDQRGIAKELCDILSGHRSPRDKTPVPDVMATAEAMVQIYEDIL